ncbi:MAG: amino acid adenylation domain-containing protein [Gemmatimonadota bacterium]
MIQPKRFDAFLVGEGSLLVRCGDALLRRGHRVRGVASPGGAPAEWAAQNGIPHAPPGGDLGAFFRSAPCDYLFSIVNRRVLPADVYGAAARAAINFHDSPLPRYAGVHATSWAILHGERVHGVTWHLIADEVDAGDVLKQRLVEVEPRDTALALNAKCYDAALESFEELVDELAEERCVPRPQDPARRSYFGLHARPAAACTVDWSRPAEEIGALVRALDFGGYTNPLGLPRAWIGGVPFLVSRAEPAEAMAGSAAPPGTVVALADDEMLVATAGSAVRVGGFRAPDGRPVRVAELAARSGLAAGVRLPSLDPAEAARLDAAYGELCRHERFWVRRLADADPLALGQGAAGPGPLPGGAVDTPLAGEVRDLLASLDPAERFPWLTAACGCFLGRIAGAVRFDVGLERALPAAARGVPHLFAEVVPLRFELRPGESFAEALDSLRAGLRELDRRGTFARDLPLRHPELRELEARLPGGRWPLSIAWEGAGGEAEAGPLRLVLAAEPAGVRWIHDPRALAPAEVEGLAAQLGAFLRGIAADPERPLAALPRVGPEERRRLVEEWSGREADDAAGRTLQELLAEQAARTPDAVAVECGGERLRYAELEERANRLARALRRIGAGPERLVGICLDGTTDAVVAMVAALKAGGAYLPLDPAYPRERLAYMVEDSGAVALVTRTEHLAVLPETAVPVLCLDGAGDGPERESAQPLSGQGSDDNLAYLIYTSGSTGRPKGVLVPQRGVVGLALSFRESFGLGPGDRLLLMVSLSFDASVGTIFSTLLGGGTLVLPRERAALGGGELLRFCEEHRITVVDMPAALWKHWLDALEEAPAGPVLPDLRLVLAGGESVQAEQLRRWAERTGGRADFVGPYGPTEATVCTTFRRAAAAETARMPEGRLPIGRPVPGARVYVLDEQLEPVPVGVPGELYVGGTGVTRGYLGRPELSAERFLPDPFRPGARVYRTGDQVRWLPGGELEFLGRTDHQVKVRGFRVELGEIEAALLAQEGVREAVVVVRGEGAAQRLAAYLVGEGAADAARLRGAVRERLPEHMVPAAFVALETLPLTPNGKVDRAALPEPQWGSAAREYVAPRDETEARLCDLWREVLGAERVGVHDSFFDLGGHSLTATQLISRVRESLGREITFRTLVQASTVAELAVAVAASEGGEEPAIIGRDTAEQLLAGLDELSEEEVERLLAGLAGDGG